MSCDRGSATADEVRQSLPVAADLVVDTLAGLRARAFTERDLAEGRDPRAALVGISEANSGSFDWRVKNASGVYYSSWAGITSHVEFPIDQEEVDACDGNVESYDSGHGRTFDHDPVSAARLEASAPIFGHRLGSAADPNDGMVTVASAPSGASSATAPRADHMDEVTRRVGSDAPGKWSRFDPIRFHRRTAFGLDADSSRR